MKHCKPPTSCFGKVKNIFYFFALHLFPLLCGRLDSFLAGASETLPVFLSPIILFLFEAARHMQQQSHVIMFQSYSREHRWYFQALYLETRDEPFYECSL